MKYNIAFVRNTRSGEKKSVSRKTSTRMEGWFVICLLFFAIAIDAIESFIIILLWTRSWPVLLLLKRKRKHKYLSKMYFMPLGLGGNWRLGGGTTGCAWCLVGCACAWWVRKSLRGGAPSATRSTPLGTRCVFLLHFKLRQPLPLSPAVVSWMPRWSLRPLGLLQGVVCQVTPNSPLSNT